MTWKYGTRITLSKNEFEEVSPGTEYNNNNNNITQKWACIIQTVWFMRFVDIRGVHSAYDAMRKNLSAVTIVDDRKNGFYRRWQQCFVWPPCTVSGQNFFSSALCARASWSFFLTTIKREKRIKSRRFKSHKEIEVESKMGGKVYDDSHGFIRPLNSLSRYICLFIRPSSNCYLTVICIRWSIPKFVWCVVLIQFLSFMISLKITYNSSLTEIFWGDGFALKSNIKRPFYHF